MEHLRLLTLLLPLAGCAASGSPRELPEDPITSRVETTAAGERYVLQEVWLRAPVEAVWAAYTTDEGWTAWASPQASIDLRVGGKVLTHYVPGAELGGPGTNTLTIASYVPEVFLTLRADLAPNWPDVMKRDAGKLSNTVLFEALGPETTRLRSYGVGYSDGPEYDALLEFFVPANEALYERLIEYVEDGVRTDFTPK